MGENCGESCVKIKSLDFILNSVESQQKYFIDWWSKNYIQNKENLKKKEFYSESNENHFSRSNGKNGQGAIETG